MIVLGILVIVFGAILIEMNMELCKTNWMGAIGYIVVVCGAAMISTSFT